MESIQELVSIFLHLDDHLNEIFRNYGTWTYAILFCIIFCETGLVITPFLPGDSLLFAVGALAASGGLNIVLLFVLLTIAAVIGDSVNYWVGNRMGTRAFSGRVRFLNARQLDKTHAFYEKHGGKTIILARFIPIIRTFAPFVAGIGSMGYGRFFSYNVVGGVVWVGGFLLAGFFFGNIPVVKHNFELVILGIILVSLLPPVIEYTRHRRQSV